MYFWKINEITEERNKFKHELTHRKSGAIINMQKTTTRRRKNEDHFLA